LTDQALILILEMLLGCTSAVTDFGWGVPGLRQAMGTAGALVGASVAGLAYKLSGQNYTITFALATIPAVLALLLTVSVCARFIPHCRRALTSVGYVFGDSHCITKRLCGS
jgi:hypothetical protein